MMETWKKHIVITVIISTILVFLLRSVVWESFFEIKLNEKLSLSGWQLSVQKSSGHILGTTYLNGVTIYHKNGSNINVDKLSVNFGILSSLISTPVFDFVSVEGLNVDLSNHYSSSIKKGGFALNIPYHIRSFFVDGRVKININKTIYDANIMIGGELIGMEAPSLKCDIVKISSPENSEIRNMLG